MIGSITLRKVKGKKGQARHPEPLCLWPIAPALGHSGRRGCEGLEFEANLVHIGRTKKKNFFLSFPI